MECLEEDDYVTSVAWAADGKHVAVGTASAQVQIWDAGRVKQIRALKGHSARVSALAWTGTTLSTGGRDSLIINHDVRCARALMMLYTDAVTRCAPSQMQGIPAMECTSDFTSNTKLASLPSSPGASGR